MFGFRFAGYRLKVSTSVTQELGACSKLSQHERVPTLEKDDVKDGPTKSPDMQTRTCIVDLIT